MQSFQVINRSWVAMGLFVLIMLSGAFLRLYGLERRSLTHPEVYVPGIKLPADISQPPPRLTLSQVLSFHFHVEQHPQGYYFFMWVWTKLFGTSLYSLRLPSVLFGIGSIILIFWLVLLTYDRRVALLSAALLAFNGHHIYWSQMARMYSMMCFLGLFSTLLLLQLMRNTDKRPLLEALYVAASWLGVCTEIVFWPFLAAQILWTMTHQGTPSRTPTRIMILQTLIVIIGSPMWTHAVYRAFHSYLDRPSLAFLQQFLSFGFLFEPDYWSIPPRGIPVIGALSLTLLATVCIGAALSDRGYRFTLPAATASLAARRLLPAAVGSILIIFVLVIFAHRRQQAMVFTGLIPMLALFMPSALNRVWPLVQARWAKLGERLPRASGLRSPFFFLTFVPVLLIFGVSFIMPLLASRLFLLFTPYLLVLIAVGVRRLSRRPFLSVPLAIFLVIIHVASVAYFQHFPTDARDYQDLARKMAPRLEEGDLIFVYNRNWATTPIFYYLDKEKYHFVTKDFDNAVSSQHGSKVWVVLFDLQQPTEEMQVALAGFRLEDQVAALRSRGLLYVKGSPPSKN